MPSYTLQPENGVQTIITKNSGQLRHDVAIRANGATAGTITLRGRKAGSDVFEEIPDGVIDLAAITTIQIEGSIAEYEVTIAGLTGATSMHLTDTTQDS